MHRFLRLALVGAVLAGERPATGRAVGEEKAAEEKPKKARTPRRFARCSCRIWSRVR
jgi:hypothetical protein